MIFLSHTGSDFADLTPLLAALATKAVETWTYEEQITVGQSFPSRMSEALQRCDRMLVAWSRASEASPHVANEIDAFYARHPEPGRILFFRLDGTAPPALHASRIYLDSRDPERDASAIQSWATGATTAGLQSEPPAVPEAHVLQHFPIGPMFPISDIPESLIDSFATLLRREIDAERVVARAVRLRREADPNDPQVTYLQQAELPLVEIGSRRYWWEAFSMAGAHGPRMLAALVLAQPEEQFNAQTRRERASLLLQLRQHS